LGQTWVSWSGQVRKISPLPGFDPQTVQPVVSLFTDWAIPTHTVEMLPIKNQNYLHPSAFCQWLRSLVSGTKLAYEHSLPTVRSLYTLCVKRSLYTLCVKNTIKLIPTSLHKYMGRETYTSLRCAVTVDKTFTRGTNSYMLSKQVFSSSDGHILTN
jgi:hypothetical protein